jgi:hypothetical protein
MEMAKQQQAFGHDQGLIARIEFVLSGRTFPRSGKARSARKSLWGDAIERMEKLGLFLRRDSYCC